VILDALPWAKGKRVLVSDRAQNAHDRPCKTESSSNPQSNTDPNLSVPVFASCAGVNTCYHGGLILNEDTWTKKKGPLSRRNFLAISSLGSVGLWLSSTDLLPARAIKGLVAETGRTILKPKFKPTPAAWDPNRLTAAWLGHSTVLINFFGMTILTDPVLGKRAGADTPLGNIGPKRLIAPALKIRELPPIDLVLLSHAHMDHLDPATLRELPGNPKVVSAAGTSDLLQATGLREPQFPGWGDRVRASCKNGDAEISAFEVKHWGARWKVDRYRGYNGYVISRGGKRIIFGGDTALTDSFKTLKSGREYDLAIMPIGAYQPWLCSHCSPEQAVRMANDAGASYVLPVHHKTFAFGREGMVEPMERLEAAIESERIALRDVGETFRLPVA
jgi:L-ascorbate metabolism protein UlaG (beta-lactamase superfamily)